MSGASTEFLRIARVLKSYGTEGEILLGFRDVDSEDLDRKEPVFIKFDGLPVPFFIESFRTKGASRALVRLTGINNIEDAEEIAGRDVYALPEAVMDYEGEDGLSVEDLVGWTLLDGDDAVVGEITGIEPIPGNPCLYVSAGNGTVMVPFHEDLVLDIDEEASRIRMEIPEGLI